MIKFLRILLLIMVAAICVAIVVVLVSPYVGASNLSAQLAIVPLIFAAAIFFLLFSGETTSKRVN